eukprot:scaffold34693_cov60-Cyclotella_meneghiniana.AAC.1
MVDCCFQFHMMARGGLRYNYVIFKLGQASAVDHLVFEASLVWRFAESGQIHPLCNYDWDHAKSKHAQSLLLHHHCGLWDAEESGQRQRQNLLRISRPKWTNRRYLCSAVSVTPEKIRRKQRQR